MAEPALSKAEPRGGTRRKQALASGGKPLAPWRCAGVPLPEWLASLEDDPQPGEEARQVLLPCRDTVPGSGPGGSSDDRLVRAWHAGCFGVPAPPAWNSPLYGRNILDDTSPLGGIDFNNLMAYVNEAPFGASRQRRVCDYDDSC